MEKKVKLALTLSTGESEEWENEYERGIVVPLKIEGRIVAPHLALKVYGRARIYYTSFPEEDREVDIPNLSICVGEEDLKMFGEQISLLAEVVRKVREEIISSLMEIEEGNLPDVLGFSLLHKFKEEVVEYGQ